jgi:hypothetical protein
MDERKSRRGLWILYFHFDIRATASDVEIAKRCYSNLPSWRFGSDHLFEICYGDFEKGGDENFKKFTEYTGNLQDFIHSRLESKKKNELKRKLENNEDAYSSEKNKNSIHFKGAETTITPEVDCEQQNVE